VLLSTRAEHLGGPSPQHGGGHAGHSVARCTPRMRVSVSTNISRRLQGLSRWTASAVGSLAVVLTWWLSSLHFFNGPDHLIGPFHVPVSLEWALGTAVVVISSVGSLRAVRGSRAGAAGPTYSVMTVSVLLAAVVLTTLAWRTITSGGDGANIGGGLILLAGPLFLAAFIQAAVSVERSARSSRLRHFVPLSLCIWLAAIGVTVFTWFLA
jgi:hypothetical protein